MKGIHKLSCLGPLILVPYLVTVLLTILTKRDGIRTVFEISKTIFCL